MVNRMGILIQMAGFPGSGKSTLAYQISKKMGAIVLDRDIIKNSMLESGIVGKVLADSSYKVVFDLASNYLSKGFDVIIDTPCYYEGIVKTGQRISRENNAQYKYIECKVESYVIVSNRLKTREKLETQISNVGEEQYYAQYDKSSKPPEIECLTVDTSSFETVEIESIIKYIQN